MSTETLNQNSVLQSFSAATPEILTSMIRQIRYQMEVISIVYGDGKYTCFFRCSQKIKVVDKKEMDN